MCSVLIRLPSNYSHNKAIFGTLFVVSELIVLWCWLKRARLSNASLCAHRFVRQYVQWLHFLLYAPQFASLCRNALRPRPPQQLLPSDESFERKPQASVPPQARTRARRRESTSVIRPQLARTRHVSSNFPSKPTSGSCASLVPGFGRASLFAKQVSENMV